MNPEYYSEDGGVVCVERKPMTDRQLKRPEKPAACGFPADSTAVFPNFPFRSPEKSSVPTIDLFSGFPYNG